MTWLTEPLGFAFFREGILAAALVGALCAMLGACVGSGPRGSATS